jgi:hypothetical protein
MKVIDHDTVKLDSPGRINKEEGDRKKRHPDMSVDDEADVK